MVLFIYLSSVTSAVSAEGKTQKTENKIVSNKTITVVPNGSVLKNISGDILLFEEKESSLDLEEIIRQHSSKFLVPTQIPKIYSMGDHTIWARLYVSVDERPGLPDGHPASYHHDQNYFLLLNYQNLEKIRVYSRSLQPPFYSVDGEIPREQDFFITQGGRETKKNDLLHKRFNIVPLKLSAGLNEVYIRVDSHLDLIRMETWLMDEAGLGVYSMKDSLFYGIYVSFVLILIILALVVFWISSLKMYLYYAIHLFMYALLMLSASGGLIYIIPSAADLNYQNYMHLINIAAHLAPAFAALFATSLLDTSKAAPRMMKFFMGAVILLLVNMVLNFSRSPITQTIFYVTVFVLILSLLGYTISQFRRNLYARYYAITVTATVVMIVLNILYETNFIQLDIWYPDLIRVKMFEMTVLAFALGLRFRSFAEEKKALSVNLRMIERDMNLARDVQKYLFPVLPERPDGFNIAARYIPSASISGDFYDYREDGHGGVFIFMADVAGHGFPAGLVASMVKVAYQDSLYNDRNLENPMENINRIILNNTESSFLTAVHTWFHPEKKELECIHCGHTPLIIYRHETQTLELLREPGLPLGVSWDLKLIRSRTFLNPGDRVYIYTDGLVEETNAQEIQFGEENLQKTILEASKMPLTESLEYILKNLFDWKSGYRQEDDITILVIEL